MSKDKEICLILNNIRSAHNVGSIFRTADAAGVSRIYLCGITPTPESLAAEKIAKVALGAEKTIPWEYCKQAWKCLANIKNQDSKIKIIGLEQAKISKNIFKFKPTFPLALVVGNEVKGLSPKILTHCDHIVEIPMLGEKESLNVSVAAGIALYRLIQ